MTDTEPPGGAHPRPVAPEPVSLDPAGSVPVGSEPAEPPDWWASTEHSPFSKLGTTATRPSAATSSATAVAEPIRQARRSRRGPRVGPPMAGWSLALLIGAGMVIAGSLSAWLNVTALLGASGHVTGVSEGSLGWVALIAAIVVAVAAVAIAASGDEASARRFFSLAAAAASGAAFATAIFALVQQPSGRGVSVGWGLILTLLGSIFVLVVSFAVNISDD